MNSRFKTIACAAIMAACLPACLILSSKPYIPPADTNSYLLIEMRSAFTNANAKVYIDGHLAGELDRRSDGYRAKNPHYAIYPVSSEKTFRLYMDIVAARADAAPLSTDLELSFDGEPGVVDRVEVLVQEGPDTLVVAVSHEVERFFGEAAKRLLDVVDSGKLDWD
jgi:hypothetical protein